MIKMTTIKPIITAVVGSLEPDEDASVESIGVVLAPVAQLGSLETTSHVGPCSKKIGDLCVKKRQD